MPRRTNKFQRLIKLLEQMLAGPKAKVQESELVRDKQGIEREIDVSIEYPVGSRIAKYAIECRDHGRKGGLEWLDALEGKYRHLPEYRVIAVHSAGFTADAKERAKLLAMEVITLDDAQTLNWNSLLSSLAAATLERWTTIVAEYIYRCERSPGFKPDEFSMLYSESGEEIGVPKDIVAALIKSPQARKAVEEASQQVDFAGETTLNFPSDHLIFFRTDHGEPVRLLLLSARCKIETESKAVPLEKKAYGDSAVAYATTEFHGKEFQIVATQRPGETHRVGMSFKPAKKKRASTSGKSKAKKANSKKNIRKQRKKERRNKRKR